MQYVVIESRATSVVGQNPRESSRLSPDSSKYRVLTSLMDLLGARAWRSRPETVISVLGNIESAGVQFPILNRSEDNAGAG